MEIKLINSESVIAELSLENEVQIIDYESIKKIAPQFNYDDVEGLWLDSFDNIVVGIIFIAQGQGSLIFAWDTEQKKIVHLTNGAYSEVLFFDGEYIYGVCNVSCWGVESHIELYRYKFKTVDTSYEGEQVDITSAAEDNSSVNNERFWIEKENDTLKFGYGEKCFIYKIN